MGTVHHYNTTQASGISITQTGIIVPSTTNVQQAIARMEQYVQNLQETFEQHHHDRRYGKYVPIVSALPSSPSDGDEIYFQSAAMLTDGIVWHLRYNSGSASAYKWEYVGGPEWGAQDDTTRTLNNAAYTSLTSPLVVTTPLAGDYYVTQNGISHVQANGGATFLSYAIGGTGAVDADSLTVQQPSTGATTPILEPGSRTKRQNAIAANTALTEKAKSAAAVGTFLYRYLSIKPIRLG